MLINILTWVIMGGLAGWVASIIMGTNRRQGCIGNILMGVLGALIGGFVMELITGRGFTMGWSWTSFLVAVIGACVLLGITGWYRRGRR